MLQKLPIFVKGHLKITDDLGTVLVDKDNAIHPMNVSRVIARALAKESNYWIHRVAFGNGGTQISAANAITYNDTNTGGVPPVAGRWTDQLYNETYSEVVDESDVAVDTGPGSVDPNSLVATNSVESQEISTISEVTITVELNENEPLGQFISDNQSPLETDSQFMFDEIGLFTTGLPLVATAGYQSVDVGSKLDVDDTGLAGSTSYDFQIDIDGTPTQVVTITTPASGSGSGGEILFSDLVILLNAALVGASASIDQSTFGKLQFTSSSTGSSSSIILADGGGPNTALFGSLTGFGGLDTTVVGEAAGSQNDVGNPTLEAERMLTHVIFSPVLKSSNRTLSIVYTLTIAVSGA